MAMSVYNAQYKLGIDRTTLQQVSQEILKRANEKNSQYNVHTTTNNIFKSADIGVDLYNGKVDVNTAKQIALNNSGLQVQLSQDALNSIKYLNSQATQNEQKNVTHAAHRSGRRHCSDSFCQPNVKKRNRHI